jgi:hypothetical protein
LRAILDMYYYCMLNYYFNRILASNHIDARIDAQDRGTRYVLDVLLLYTRKKETPNTERVQARRLLNSRDEKWKKVTFRSYTISTSVNSSRPSRLQWMRVLSSPTF